PGEDHLVDRDPRRLAVSFTLRDHSPGGDGTVVAYCAKVGWERRDDFQASPSGTNANASLRWIIWSFFAQPAIGDAGRFVERNEAVSDHLIDASLRDRFAIDQDEPPAGFRATVWRV